MLHPRKEEKEGSVFNVDRIESSKAWEYFKFIIVNSL